MYLYLVDEVTNVAVVPGEEDDTYPIEIDLKAEWFNNFISKALPCIKCGFKLFKAANFISGLFMGPSIDEEVVER